jgi:AcrB/AcrD/AcrF family
MVAGGGFEPPTFGLCDLTHLSMRVGLYLHPRGMLAIQSLRLPPPFRGLGSVLPYRSRDVGSTDFDDIETAAIEGAVQRLRPKLMTVCAVLASLIPILWASGIGSDVMKPIAAPMVGGIITSTIHVLILVPVFFVLMKERALGRGTLWPEPAE